MNFELQLRTERVEASIRSLVESRFLTRDLGIGGVRPSPVSGTDGVFDHAVVSSVHLRTGGAVDQHIALPPLLGTTARRDRTVTARELHVDVVLDLFFVELPALLAGGVAGAAPTAQFQARLRVALDAPVALDHTLRIVAHTIELALGPGGGVFFGPDDHLPPALDGLAAQIRELNQPEALARLSIDPIELDVGGVLAALGPDFAIWNVALRPIGDALVVRLQVEPTAAVDLGLVGSTWIAAWTAFFAATSNRLGGQDWQLLLPTDVFAHRVDTEIRAAITGDAYVLHEDVPPHSTWSVPGSTAAAPDVVGGTAQMTTSFAVIARGACKPTGMDMDVNCGLDLTITMVDAALHIELVFRHAVDEGDAVACALINMFLGGAALFVIGGVIGGWVGAIIGGVIGAVGGVIGTIVGIETAGVPSLASDAIRAVPGAPDHYVTELAIPSLTNPVFGRMTPAVFTASPDGVLVGGAMSPQVNALPQLGAFSVRQPPGWRWLPASDHCPVPPAPLDFRALAFLTIPYSIPGHLALSVWGVEVRGSTPGGYVDALTVHPRLYTTNIELELELAEADARRLRDAATAVDPEIQILIQTNAGARLLRVPGVPATLTDAILADARDARRADCQGRANREANLRERARRFIDVMGERFPPIDLGRRAVREWNLAIAGLVAGERVSVYRDGTATPLATWTASASGMVRGQVWQLADDPPLSVRIDTQRAGAKDRAAVAFLEYAPLSTIQLGGDYRDHHLSRTGGRLQLAVVTGRGLGVYDLAAPLAPRLSTSVRLAGMSHARWRAGQVTAWGPGGAWQPTTGRIAASLAAVTAPVATVARTTLPVVHAIAPVVTQTVGEAPSQRLGDVMVRLDAKDRLGVYRLVRAVG